LSDDLSISPEPTPAEREAILRAVRAVLEREASLARPPIWTLAGWTQRRAGLADFGRWIDSGRRWALSARLPIGSRAHAGLHGRGDAK
jgi:hypothetical protein